MNAPGHASSPSTSWLVLFPHESAPIVVFSLRKNRVLLSSFLGIALTGAVLTGSATASHADSDQVLLQGSTKASYFWDDASGRFGDTGLPASGKPMQKGMFASPSWPLGTEGYVVYKGKKAPFFIGDRGPGIPSNNGVMLDIDAKTFADLTGGRFNTSTLMVNGNGGLGHINVDYVVTKWGKGYGKKNHPVAFSTGWYKRFDRNPATPPKVDTVPLSAEVEKSAAKKAEKAERAGRAEKAEEQAVAAESTPVTPAAEGAAPAPAQDSVNLSNAVAAAVKTPADHSNGILSLAVLAAFTALAVALFLTRERLRVLLGRRGGSEN
ncbi:hypothetical protein [Sinosporangium siamense]|uniref:hypothetical protein n=1 Tax=Sinosporangium siamense TaxID=1367973 RepID=UPI001EF169D9|nr:hypothetical protein [Sinosporangium siamense]